MINAYVRDGTGLRAVPVGEGEPVPPGTVWLDMLSPEPAEAERVEAQLGIDLPAREEMQEIEVSSRLYREGDTLFMTAIVLSSTNTERPQAAAVTFILGRDVLVTVRHAEPQPFTAFAKLVARGGLRADPAALLVGLLEAVVDRVADILEKVAQGMDHVSHTVFAADPAGRSNAIDSRDALSHIARLGDLDSKVRESLSSINRLPGYLNQSNVMPQDDRELQTRLGTVAQDISSLTDYCTFLANKINFMLEATLGLINIEQNAIIKIFSVMAVVLLPPTVVASIYGMNFRHMPELGWFFGYPMALVIMLASAILPYWFFKRRGWL